LKPGGSGIHLHTNSTHDTEDETHITITKKKTITRGKITITRKKLGSKIGKCGLRPVFEDLKKNTT
jgi:hypothetical protein